MFTVNPTLNYRIMSVLSGQALDIDQGDLRTPKPSIQYPWHEGDAQFWNFVIVNGLYQIRAAKKPTLHLGVSNGSTANNAQVELSATNNPDTFWEVEADVAGCSFSIVNHPPNSTSRKLMRVKDESLRQTELIVIHERTGSQAEKWMAYPV